MRLIPLALILEEEPLLTPFRARAGCDKKVLLWTDPSRAGQMDAYVTGGNRGDGTVFALDLHEVRLADLSSAPSRTTARRRADQLS